MSLAGSPSAHATDGAAAKTPAVTSSTARPGPRRISPAPRPAAPAPLVLPSVPHQGEDEHEHGQREDDPLDPVAGVGEDEHVVQVLTADNNQSPRLVNPTITTSIQYWERTASRDLRYIAIARSCARMRPQTWPVTSAATCTYQVVLEEMALRSIVALAVPKRFDPSPSGSDTRYAAAWPWKTSSEK